MLSDHEPRKQLTVPTFESKLPESLLTNLSPHDRQLYIANDEMRQTISWMAGTLAGTANRVEDVHEQATKTNGRVTVIEDEIKELRAGQLEAASEIETVRAAKAVVRSRWFWIGTAAFFLVVLPWTAAHVQPSIVWDILVTMVSG